MATEVELSLGQHQVLWSLAGYADLNATIDVTESAVTCVSGPCGVTGPPGVIASGFVVTGHLLESAVNDFTSWVESKGGSGSIEYADALEIGDGYLGLENIGFTPTYADVLTCGDYYLGL